MDRPIPSRASGSDRHVLIVDDDRDFAESLRNLLKLEGYQVEVSYSMSAALDALYDFEVEVALIDVRMGDQDGLALVSEFRQRREAVICVVITAYASVETAIQALQKGAYDFLCKPFYPEDLIATLERCFERLALKRDREAAERALFIRNRELEAVNGRLKRAVAAMHALSSSATLPALYTTAIETLAHVMGAENAALYLTDGSELALHKALRDGLPSQLSLPGTRTFERPMFVVRTAAAQAGLALGDAPPNSHLSQDHLLAFPLISDSHKPIGLLVLQPAPNSIFSNQDQELGVILASFINEAIRLLQALDNVRWSEARLRGIIDNSPSLISLNDPQGRYLIVNRQFEAWHGRSAREVLGRRPRDLFSPDVAYLYETRPAITFDNSKIVEEETEVVFEDGSSHTLLVTRFAIRGADGRSMGIGTIATDVTERRRAEEHLRHSQQLEALGQLTGGIAHDFNNLLAVIIGNLDLLQEKSRDQDANRALIEDSLSSASSGKDLVQRLLAFGRRQSLKPEPTDVNSIVSGVARVIERTLGETIETRWILNNDLWPITVDKSQFETSLLNLMFNSRDAMPRGGLLTIETNNIAVNHVFGEREIVAPGSYVTVAVTDNGTGMTPVVAAQAPQPFFTTKDPGDGSGLGLSMVYGFVKQSGGYLMIHSKPAGGTSVTLYFPRANDAAARSNEPNGDGVELFVQSERVLVVEDKSMVRKMAKAMLTSLGYIALEAEDALNALALLQQGPQVHLLLTDILLTGHLDGFELAKEAKRRRPELKVLFMSGYAEAALSRNEELGARLLVVEKPFTKETLARKVRQALAGEP
jgi:PAS domain S-box-containing protein